jgi:hypothetical protein
MDSKEMPRPKGTILAHIQNEPMPEVKPRAEKVRACTSGCGYQVTWLESLCCKRCESVDGPHGRKCARKLAHPTTPPGSPPAEEFVTEDVHKDDADEGGTGFIADEETSTMLNVRPMPKGKSQGMPSSKAKAVRLCLGRCSRLDRQYPRLVVAAR